MRVSVTGGTGFLGRHVVEALESAGHAVHVLGGRRTQDLRAVAPPLDDAEILVHLAYPGTKGIQTSWEAPADLVHDQLRIDLNVIAAAAQRQVPLVCVGSVCEYPEQLTYPAGEDQLWAGYPEAVNAPYGIAKRMQQGLLEAYRRQYGLQSTQLILGNLYGPGDRSGHVIPSLIRRAKAAATTGSPLVVWGDGTATREFLYVTDAARAIVAAVEAPPQTDPINIVSGNEQPIRVVAKWIASFCGVNDLQWDSTKPNGQPRRYFSYRRAYVYLSWAPRVSFVAGLQDTVEWLCREEAL